MSAIFVVGIGPGDRAHMSLRALEAIGECDVVVGYKTYMNLIGDLVMGKKVYTSGMRSEVPRAEQAIALARSGQRVAVVSSGDPGIYGMAGLVLELLRPAEPVEVEIVPGISALSAAAAALGAPLMHDFCAISLSDLLTPWELIEKRLEAAAAADFVTVLYNPKSRGRRRHIERAREIFLAHRSPDTVVGVVRNAMRGPLEQVSRSALATFPTEEIDMLTTVIIGNSQTALCGGFMVTPRGYRIESD